MNSKNLGRFARIALATAALMGAQFASAQVAAGSVIRLGDGTGSLAGVYNGSVISGPGAASGSFQTFCLEKFEYFGSHTQNLYVKSVSTATQNATGGDSNATKVSGGAAGSDSLSAQTAYLFTQFYSNQAAYAGTQSLANSMQRAVWFLEGELAGSDLRAYNSDSNATAWVTAANTAVSSGAWSGLGNVRVLNLYTNAAYTSHSQDQLYMVTAVPEPQTYALMLAGLGLIGTIARRRKSKSA
jgi:hypothetical protein